MHPIKYHFHYCPDCDEEFQCFCPRQNTPPKCESCDWQARPPIHKPMPEMLKEFRAFIRDGVDYPDVEWFVANSYHVDPDELRRAYDQSELEATR